MKQFACLIITLICVVNARCEDGYDLWLRYKPVINKTVLQQYKNAITGINLPGTSPTLLAARAELQMGLKGMLGRAVNSSTKGSLIAGTPSSSKVIASLHLESALTTLGDEGFLIKTSKADNSSQLVIAANTDAGVLYGVFHLLRLMQTNADISRLNVSSSPLIKHRLLNHWDNLNRTVERGYAGFSLWDWHKLPDFIDQRYIDYARANASIGINGTVITNVNANALILTKPYLEKVAALAATFRPYGIKIYLTARFSAPIEIGKLKTADPLNDSVRLWWKQKAAEIYSIIPDFGGFLVKANSEGQPGPQDYKRNHADGANMLAEAVAPYKGIIMWRSFVYSSESPEDRLKQAYTEFKPLDGKFNDNVAIQVKNGPLDFQPREPFSPLFGAMPQTPLFMEYQLTQEYLGFATHLVYEGTLFKEVLETDTYSKGKGSTVGKVLDGSLHKYALTGMAGVANIGNEINWTGHPFAQANWYALGRLAWNHNNSAASIAEEWVKMTYGNHPQTVNTLKNMMMQSREIMVNYMTPLGLHHIMGYGHHYGPAPWYDRAPRADWNPVYFHRADEKGLGFDRTASGTNYLAQYQPEVQEKYKDMKTCPEEFLLWFHHVPWTFKMNSGRTMWQELCYKYYSGVEGVRKLQKDWHTVKNMVDPQRFRHVEQLLTIQEKEAVWWRNACLLYFQTFSKMPIPDGYEKPDHTLDYYKSLQFPSAPH